MSLSKTEAEALAAIRQHVKANNIGSSLRNHDPLAEPQGVVDNPADLIRLHASTDIIVKDVADLLTRRMPGFRWAVQPNEKGGVLNIFCLDFHSVWGYVIRYDDIMNDPKRREAIRAGRAILARFRYPGTVYRPELMAAIPRTPDGQAIPNLSDMKPTRFTKKAELDMMLATGKARVIGTKGSGKIIEVPTT